MRIAAWVCLFLATLPSAIVLSADHQSDSDPFALDGARNILAEPHFGIANRKATCGIPYKNAAGIAGLWAPPYASSGFKLDVTLFGQSVATEHYVWHPTSVERRGTMQGLTVATTTMLLPGSRAGMLAVTVTNGTKNASDVPVGFTAGGTLDKVGAWEFGVAQSTTATTPAASETALRLEQGGMAVVLQADRKAAWDASRGKGSVSLKLAPSANETFHIVFAIGPTDEAVKACSDAIADPARTIADAKATYDSWTKEIFEKLPRLESNNPALNQFYCRSLVPLLNNRWDVPEFVLHPYYSTGSINGGCVCEYLWNYGDCWEILPLYTPQAAKEHIKKFVAIDMTKHFAFEPLTGNAFGPWYMVNQEKIIGSIYYYVRLTGDTAFLNEAIDGKTILEHVVLNAMYGDDPAKPVAMIDYGASNSHLELRRGIPYNHVMPDLNGRRYQNYMFAAELANLAGRPSPQLRQRAKQLKKVLKQTLWNKSIRWFDFQDDKGHKDTRYTVQMFKLFGSNVLDAEEEAGLLSHFQNRKEFVSDFGLHSLAKTDRAYDPADIDNGGPGICTGFVGQIAEKLYKAGKPAPAEQLLKRVLWWGDRMPYWGDSITADRIDYRRDTPLQSTIDGVALAQSIIFGMFGVQVQWNGDVRIDPHPPAYASQIALRGLRIRGHVLDILVHDGEFEVRNGERQLRSTVGNPVLVRSTQP